MEKKYTTHLERNWIFYLLCLSVGITHLVFKIDQPTWLGYVELAVAGVIEVLIKGFFKKKYGFIGAQKYGIY